MRLWVFGDSFSDLKQGESLSQVENWIRQLGNLLSVDDIVVRAQYGVSNEWIYNELVSCSPTISRDDYVIVQLTDPSRHWFVKDPTLSNLTTLSSLSNADLDRLSISREQKEAAQQYIKYLFNQETDDILYHQLFHSLAYMANVSDFRYMRMVPGFSPLPAIEGTLVDICANEFVDKEEKIRWYDVNRIDPRVNHLTKNNHRILAEKLKDFIENPGSTLDLRSGFEEKFLKVENV